MIFGQTRLRCLLGFNANWQSNQLSKWFALYITWSILDVVLMVRFQTGFPLPQKRQLSLFYLDYIAVSNVLLYSPIYTPCMVTKLPVCTSYISLCYSITISLIYFTSEGQYSSVLCYSLRKLCRLQKLSHQSSYILLFW